MDPVVAVALVSLVGLLVLAGAIALIGHALRRFPLTTLQADSSVHAWRGAFVVAAAWPLALFGCALGFAFTLARSGRSTRHAVLWSGLAFLAGVLPYALLIPRALLFGALRDQFPSLSRAADVLVYAHFLSAPLGMLLVFLVTRRALR